jgi:hypothetical protein
MQYDFITSITIEASSEEEALDIFYGKTKHLDITLSEMEAK